MAIFNNPADQQQIMTLARQMYPTDPHHFVRYFRQATTKPYGYLLVDLKPTTKDFLRLRNNVLPRNKQNVLENDESLLEHVETQSQQSEAMDGRGVETLNDSSTPEKRIANRTEFTQVTTNAKDDNDENEERKDDLIACPFCDIVFANRRGRDIHIINGCPSDIDEDEPVAKRPRSQMVLRSIWFDVFRPHLKDRWSDQIKEKGYNTGRRGILSPKRSQWPKMMYYRKPGNF